MDLSFSCPHFSLCSGCSTQSGAPSIAIDAENYFRELGIPYSFHAGCLTGWRTRSKLAVRGDINELKIGLYEAGTHQARSIPHCAVHSPEINEAVARISRWIKDEKITPFNEETQKGELRYLVLSVERSSATVQAGLVMHGSREISSSWAEKVRRLGSDETFWHSLWLNFNITLGNAILGDQWQRICGKEWLWERLAGADVCFLPGSFAQANLGMFEKLLQDLKTKFPIGSSAVEYYAGVGVIGLSLKDLASSVELCEVNPEAKRCFDNALGRLSPDLASKYAYHLGPSGKYTKLIEQNDVVIADPPRKGLDGSLLKSLQHADSPKQLFYISCGFDSFKRDCSALISSGWKLQEAQGYLFFPGTNSLETLALFQK